MRLHAPYVSEKETAAVVGFLEGTRQAEYVEGFLESPKDERATVDGSNPDPDENDPMFDDAVRLVFEFGKASTSLLQRRLRIGYGRAAHLIDLMERDGLVGPADGSRPRELLKAPGWLHEHPFHDETVEWMGHPALWGLKGSAARHSLLGRPSRIELRPVI
jgi:S-DNA-T family DNA segregation ATPase FtsK/SpoIIIE